MRASSSRILAGLLLAAIACIAIGVWLGGGQRQAPTAASPGPASGSPPRAGVAGSRRADPPATGDGTQALPRPEPNAWTNPLLVDDFEALQRRADEGDAAAMCRLGYKLLHCAASAGLANDRRLMEDALPPGIDPPNVPNLLAMRGPARAFVALCRKAPDDARERGWSLVRDAALAGHVEAMFRYGRGDAFAFSRIDPDGPQFAQWLQEAPAMLDGALRRGYLPAVSTLWQARLSEDGGDVDRLVPDDPLQAQALEFLIRLLGGHGTSEEDMGWTRYPEVATQADALARAWHQRWFGGRTDASHEDFRLPYARWSDIYTGPGELSGAGVCTDRPRHPR